MMAWVMASLVTTMFWLIGLICLFSPARVQQFGKYAYRGTPLAGFAGKVFDSKAYVFMLRIIGVASLGVACAITGAMILYFLGYAEPA